MRECTGTLLRQSSSWTIDWQGPSEESCRTAPRIVELQCRRGKCSQPDFGAFHSSVKVALVCGQVVPPSLVNSRMAGRVPTQCGSWESPGVESGEEGVLLKSDAVRSTWAQMIAVASAGGTGGREGRGANAGRGTGGVLYQTP